MGAAKNGKNKFRHKKNGNNSKRKSSPRIGQWSDSSKLGFQKAPKVVVTPIEITRYLNASNKKMDCSGVLLPHRKRFEQTCVVKLRRENLVELRDALTRTKTSDPDNISCKICGKLYTSTKKLQNHHENKHTTLTITPVKKVRFSDHVIVHEVTDYHSCRKCSRMFENYALLKKHMKKTHKKRKCYICNYCSKEFMDRIIFKVHIKLHCDACGLLFPTRAKYLEHRRNICKILKRYKCYTCNEICFKYMDLKDHSYAHIGSFIVCDICKEKFKSYCEIAHHICFLHSNKRPDSLYVTSSIGDETLYQCNFCDKSFAYKTLMESHIEKLPDLNNRSMTGYKDYYFCDTCLAQFDSEKEMLQHKWSHFVKTNAQKPETEVQTIFKLNEIPKHYLQSKVIIKKSKEAEEKLQNMQPLEDTDSNSIRQDESSNSVINEDNLNSLNERTDLTLITEDNNLNSTDINKKKKRKITFSDYQCQNCQKYFYNAFTLRRHISNMHRNYEDLQCKVCEEVFVWPSLLASHKCIRLHHSEMPFDDARPEIQLENLYEINDLPDTNNHFVDFDVPDPIVDICEEDSVYVPPMFNPVKQYRGKVNNGVPSHVGYKLVLQEVPIEF